VESIGREDVIIIEREQLELGESTHGIEIIIMIYIVIGRGTADGKPINWSMINSIGIPADGGKTSSGQWHTHTHIYTLDVAYWTRVCVRWPDQTLTNKKICTRRVDKTADIDLPSGKEHNSERRRAVRFCFGRGACVPGLRQAYGDGVL